MLKYHVVSGKVMASDAAKLSSARTLHGAEAKISAGADGVSIDKAKIV